MESQTVYSKHMHFNGRKKWRLEYLGTLGIMGVDGPLNLLCFGEFSFHTHFNLRPVKLCIPAPIYLRLKLSISYWNNSSNQCIDCKTDSARWIIVRVPSKHVGAGKSECHATIILWKWAYNGCVMLTLPSPHVFPWHLLDYPEQRKMDYGMLVPVRTRVDLRRRNQ